MNFLEAVRELKEGRCEGIRRIGQIASYYLNGTMIMWDSTVPMCSDAINFLADDWQLDNPKPQFEEVETHCWQLIDEQGGNRGFYHGADSVSLSPEEKKAGWQIIKLTGTYRREIPRKVKRREQLLTWDIIPSCLGGSTRSVSCSGVPVDAKFYAEWYEEEK